MMSSLFVPLDTRFAESLSNSPYLHHIDYLEAPARITMLRRLRSLRRFFSMVPFIIANLSNGASTPPYEWQNQAAAPKHHRYDATMA